MDCNNTGDVVVYDMFYSLSLSTLYMSLSSRINGEHRVF